MIPLLQVTDLRYVQSPLGRLLNYGTFRLESASRRNVLRTIADLPNPNELYLRLVEELYEPEAVEARLGYHVDEEPDGDPSAEVDEEAVGGPPGWPFLDSRPEPALPATGPRDPASVRQEVILRVGELAGHLAALTEAITRLEPAPPAAAPPREMPVSDELSAPAFLDEQPAVPDGRLGALARSPVDEQETGRPIPHRRRPTLADPLPDVAD